ncbi:nSTAND1 domain-containing NTPase [Streptomyces sp. NPDC003442]
MDPAAGPVQRFAYELRKLRQETEGLTYRAMAQRTEYSVTTLSRAAAGEQLPSLAVVLAYARACGADPQEWERRWRGAAGEAIAEPGTDDIAHAPYRGLARFEPDDRELFFGREDLVAQLADRVDTHRLVALVGASGSGKSSLLRAGLIPRLRAPSEHGPQPAAIRVITPGERPLRTHAQRLAPAEKDGDTVLIVDQFEELYTLGTPPHERNQFIDHLLAATDPTSRLRVIIAVRADFLSRCAEHHLLAAALREATLLVGPMSPAELRQAIVKPAAAAGLIVERALTAKIIEDVTDRPGGLPLMSHALLETWRRSTGRALTLTAYNAAGGVAGALAQSAEDLYTQLSHDQAAGARGMLLRLISPGEGAEDTRRPAPAEELETGTSSATAEVLERLVKARLVTLDGSTVHLAHEALITAWPRLRKWIDEARERLRLHRQLTEAARTWQVLDRDPGALYRGTRLATAEEAFLEPCLRSDLTTLEEGFLAASTTDRDREVRAAARTTRRLRQFITALSMLLALALTAGLIAWHEYHISERQRNEAVTEQQMALSRQLAVQSGTRLGSSPDLASLLAVQAYRVRPTKEAIASLFAAAALPLQQRLTGHRGIVRSVAFSPDGRTLASSSDDDSVRLRDAASGKTRIVLSAGTSGVESVAFSPNGRFLAGGGGDGTTQIWDAATGKLRTALKRQRGGAMSVAFSPDGRVLASGGGDGTVRLWDVASGRLRKTLRGHSEAVWSVAFSPDGRVLASGGGDGTVRLWDVVTGRLRKTLRGHSEAVWSVAFSPDGRVLASGGGDGAVRLWDVASGMPRTIITGQNDGVTAVAFSPDGRTLASGGRKEGTDRAVRLWDAATGRLRNTLTGHKQAVETLAFSPDGRTLASGGDDGAVRCWDPAVGNAPAVLPGHSRDVRSVAFRPDGRMLASSGDDQTVGLWDLASGRDRAFRVGGGFIVNFVAFSPDGRTLVGGSYEGRLWLWNAVGGKARTFPVRAVGGMSSVAFSPNGRAVAGGSDDGSVWLRDMRTERTRTFRVGTVGAMNSVAFSPDGRTLASGSDDGSVWLWDTATGIARPPLIGHQDAVESVAFSPNGRTLATGSADGAVRMWDVGTGRTHTTLFGHEDTVNSVAFSPDGHTVASGSKDGTVRLWDVATDRVRATLTGHGSAVDSVAFSPDGHTVASGSKDGTVRMSDVPLPDPAEAISKICHAVHRELTAQERSQYLQRHVYRSSCSLS